MNFHISQHRRKTDPIPFFLIFPVLPEVEKVKHRYKLFKNSANFFTALPLWLILFFSPGGICAKVLS